jgi:hypothetical protein
MPLTLSDRPFILQLLKKKEESMERQEEDKATSKKRKRSYACGSSPVRPSSPNVQTLSPSKQRKRHIEKDVLGMTIPSSDIEEDEISIPSMNLALEGRFSLFVILERNFHSTFHRR